MNVIGNLSLNCKTFVSNLLCTINDAFVNYFKSNFKKYFLFIFESFFLNYKHLFFFLQRAFSNLQLFIVL